tara:strand:+ start:24 stop:272 length:249 start_codon:yes stop_codon:yes gene_type:complete
MKRLVLPLLAALALPNAVNSQVDPEIAEMCMKAVDFQGSCAASMTIYLLGIISADHEYSNVEILLNSDVQQVAGNLKMNVCV